MVPLKFIILWFEGEQENLVELVRKSKVKVSKKRLENKTPSNDKPGVASGLAFCIFLLISRILLLSRSNVQLTYKA
jgi:hypothetical protein